MVVFYGLCISYRVGASPQFSGGQLPPNLLMGGRISGYIDFHTHPMSYLGFGEKAMHGAPDLGLVIPSSMYWCVPSFTGYWEGYALGQCSGTHGAWSLDNGCGNFIRWAAVNFLIDKEFNHAFEGYPHFASWPNQSSILHQQMWWEWIRRAHQGGLSVLVALTVNNETLARILDGNPPYGDRETADKQINEMIKMVNNHDFMEIAKSSQDVRRIVKKGKLAVILGMEVDHIGSLGRPGYPQPTLESYKSEIRRLYSKGIRYIFPIHMVDNPIGGAAVDEEMANWGNKDINNRYFQIEHNPTVNYNVNNESLELKDFIEASQKVTVLPSSGWIMGLIEGKRNLENYITVEPGHANALGLTQVGEKVIVEMMKLGMLIDLDHMSEKSMTRTIELAEKFAEGYPLIFGHGGIRDSKLENGNTVTERSPPEHLVRRVAALGGMFGLGTSDTNPANFREYYRNVRNVMGPGRVGIGTDANGFIKLPRNSLNDCAHQSSPSNSHWKKQFYSAFFGETNIKTKSRLAGRIWDYTEDCVAHYGLMPEFIFDVKRFNDGQDVYQDLMRSAEQFTRMWELAEIKAAIESPSISN